MTGEKIRMGDGGPGDKAPLIHEPRKSVGGARRVAERPTQPAEALDGQGTAPPAPAVLSDAEASDLRKTLAKLDSGKKPTRAQFEQIRSASRSALSTRLWAQDIADELGRITSLVNESRTSVLELRARLIGSDPVDLLDDDEGATDDEPDGLD